MRRTAFLLLLLTASCGDHRRDVVADLVGSYVMGDAAKAREKVANAGKPSPYDYMTLGDLIKESGKHPIVLTASTDLLLELREDGRFVYYGPLKMGDEMAALSGTWSGGASGVVLSLDQPSVVRPK